MPHITGGKDRVVKRNESSQANNGRLNNISSGIASAQGTPQGAAFATITVNDLLSLVANSASDTLKLYSGKGVILTADAPNRKLTIQLEGEQPHSQGSGANLLRNTDFTWKNAGFQQPLFWHSTQDTQVI